MSESRLGSVCGAQPLAPLRVIPDAARRVMSNWAVLSLCAASLVGCRTRASTLELVSLKDPYFPETYRVTFDECVVWKDATGGRHFVARAASPLSDESDEQIEQILDAHLFWKPNPGRTPANPTTMNVTLRYIIQSPNGFALYTGTGFVYLKKKKRWSDVLIGELENGHLNLDSQMGDVPDLLGTARVTGTLYARPDGNRAVALIREIDFRLSRAQE